MQWVLLILIHCLSLYLSISPSDRSYLFLSSNQIKLYTSQQSKGSFSCKCLIFNISFILGILCSTDLKSASSFGITFSKCESPHLCIIKNNTKHKFIYMNNEWNGSIIYTFPCTSLFWNKYVNWSMHLSVILSCFISVVIELLTSSLFIKLKGYFSFISVWWLNVLFDS